VTPAGSHYVVDIDLNDPSVDPGDWRLSVEGLVERPLKLSFEDLQRRFPLVGEYAVLTCISNRVGGPLVGNSLWHGVRLRELLHAAEPRERAREVVFQCADGYTAAIPLEQAVHPSVLVAIAQDGKSLTREHGFPCRLRAPALYGIKNPKWLERLELTDRHYEGFWQQQGWTDSAVVRTESRIDAPATAASGKPTWIAGLAWAGLRGISRVEVSTEGGRSWHRARLQQPLSPYAWTRWAYAWTPPHPGRYELICRATDGHGRPQDPVRRPPHPSGASGYHRRGVEVT
jgi:DMSO/TMAO reductase YedYZ molybdopterin-dependent catalytic subunit